MTRWTLGETQEQWDKTLLTCFLKWMPKHPEGDDPFENEIIEELIQSFFASEEYPRDDNL